MMQLIEKLLEQIPFFWEFTPQERSQLANEDSFFVNFKPGETIIQEGDPNDSCLYILIRGKVQVSRCIPREVQLATLEEGAVIGEIAFLTEEPRTTTVTAADSVTAFRINSKSLRHLDLNLQNKIKDQLLRILIRRLSDMNQAMINLVR